MSSTTFSGPVTSTNGFVGAVTGGLTLSGRGTVTQITSATTTVIVNAKAGAITTVVQNILAAGEVEFTVTNSSVAATSVVVAAIASGSTGGTSHAYVKSISAGSFVLGIANLHATVAETGTLVINFAVVLTS